MDSPKEEKNRFSRITSILKLSETEMTEPGVLSTEIIEQVLRATLILFSLIC